ncbi:UNVERIFIED_CONTAM: hypothetical protein GTU68_031042, partial [Idotea baltica]|nr:hypothetical protein [Idotea baltica]
MAKLGDEQYKNELDEIRHRHYDAIQSLFEGEDRIKVKSFIDEKLKNMNNLLNGIFLIKDCTPRLRDCICSFGELASSYIIAHYFKRKIGECQFLDSRQMIKTDNSFGNALVNFEATNLLIQSAVQTESRLYLMGGFMASDQQDVTTTLGRGGSDYTGAIMAAATDSEVLEIWTDVNGVMTADPRKVKKAFSVAELTFEEAMEMSHFGAKVIHPPTIQPLLDKNIPIKIKNTFQPDFLGTLITRETNDKRIVKGVSSIGNVSLINVSGSGMVGVAGIAGRIFSCLATANVNIILITQASSEHSICFAILPKDADHAIKALQNHF